MKTTDNMAAGATDRGQTEIIRSGRVVRASGVRTARRETGGSLMRKTKQVTLFELIEAVQDTSRSDEEAVAVLTHLLRTVRLYRELPAAAA